MKHYALLSAAAAGILALAACSDSQPAEDDLTITEEGLTDDDVAAEEAALAADASAAADAEAEDLDLEAEPDEPAVPGGETVGGDGSAINLTPLGYAQIEPANLKGELGCSFSRQTDAGPLLVARADVVPDGLVTGVVALAGTPERIAQANAGGFNDLLDGIELSSRGMTLRLETTGEDQSEGEGSIVPATLTVLRGDGAERIYEGNWTCGP